MISWECRNQMGNGRVRRICRSCGGRLAADNRTYVCSPCVRGADLAPEMPNEFWARPGLVVAFEQQRFGQVIRAYRQARGVEVTQARVARWLGISQMQVSRIERGKSAVNNLAKLDKWSR